MIIKVYTKFQNLNFQYNNLILLQETQDELTSELLDLKEKYREVVDLLRDANEEIRRGRKRTYPGAGKHSVPSIFSTQPSQKGEKRKLFVKFFSLIKILLWLNKYSLYSFFLLWFSLLWEYSILTIPFFTACYWQTRLVQVFLYTLINISKFRFYFTTGVKGLINIWIIPRINIWIPLMNRESSGKHHNLSPN